MKTNLRRTSAILLIAAIAFWIYAGANPGWTRTAVPVKTLDKVTGIEGVSWQKQFVPGVDFLMVAAVGAGLLFGVSCFFRDRKPETEPEPKHDSTNP